MTAPTGSTTDNLPIILVPGRWLGGWAWDDVARHLRADKFDVTPVTLPGLESADAARGNIRFLDHVAAVRDALPTEPAQAVMVAHSGAGAVVTGVLDEVPERIARVVYVDSGPSAAGDVPVPELAADAVETPLPPFDELEVTGGSLEGLDEQALETFRERAVPHPARTLSQPLEFTNPDRNAVPATIVCCSLPSEVLKQQVDAGNPMFVAVADLTDLSYVDLPTGHWPMWSRPADLAEVIADAARDAGPAASGRTPR